MPAKVIEFEQGYVYAFADARMLSTTCSSVKLCYGGPTSVDYYLVEGLPGDFDIDADWQAFRCDETAGVWTPLLGRMQRVGDAVQIRV